MLVVNRLGGEGAGPEGKKRALRVKVKQKIRVEEPRELHERKKAEGR
jgi:hypothetical protein